MQDKGFGPDILQDLSTSDLESVGFTLGDAIRMKKAAPDWWKTAGNVTKNAKRKRTDDDHNGSLGGFDLDGMSVRVEKRWKGEPGGHTMSGTLRQGGPGDDGDDGDQQVEWFFFCDATNCMLPVPTGFIVQIEGDDMGHEDD